MLALAVPTVGAAQPVQTAADVEVGPPPPEGGVPAGNRGGLAKAEAGPAPAEEADDSAAIASATFPLPTLGPVLESVCRRLIDGCGFALIRGLPIERYDQRQAAAVFFGIGAHLGNARPQNAAGHILGHVDRKSTRLNPRHKPNP